MAIGPDRQILPLIPIPNQVYVPISAGVSTICSSKGETDASGCIAVLKTPNDDMSQKLASFDR
jgi:hypothetical protein